MSKVSRGHAIEWWHLATSTVLAVALVGLGTHRLAAQASVQGQWHTLPYLMPINPIHIALLHTGKVLIVAGSGNNPAVTDFQASVWDPETGSFFTQSNGWDMFCNAMIALSDGRIFINGGNLAYDPFVGEARSAVFDPTTLEFSDVENMAHGRWYPTVTMLGDGRVMTFSGLTEDPMTNQTVEIYTVGSGWSPEYVAGWGPPLYPRMHLLPDGRVAAVAPQRVMRIFDPTTNTWSTGATTIYTGQRIYGSSVLLPLRPSEGYKARIMILGGGSGGVPSTATTEIIDMSAPTPQWQSGPPMSQARVELNATILPNGKVLTIGGSVNDEDAATASYNADLYDPITNTFSSAGVNVYPRLYHSGSLLLPDGTVMFVGGNPVRGTYERHIEIYSPAYLFNADDTPAIRPTITSITPGTVAFGNTFQVQTPDAASIASVVLVRLGSQTHSFDMDQRLIELTFTKGNGVLTATAPPTRNIAPPGYYMLFVLNSAGVPSVATFLRMQAVGATPPGLVGAYAFNEGAGGTATDASGNGNAGAISGATWTATGKFGSALNFNGASARVNIADSSSLDLTDAFTLEGWVFPTVVTSGWRTLIGKNVDRYYLMAGSNLNTPAAGGTFATQAVFATGALPVNTWTHLAATYDRITLRLFVNGVQVASGAQTAPVSTSTGTLTIGGNAYGEYFSGLIDEVRVYNRALTAGEIQSDMATPLAGGSNSAPTATITSPASNVTINPGAPVSFSGTGTDADGTIASYGWTFPGGTPSASSVAAPGNVTYSTPGMYTASLTVTDNGGAASSPATRTVTVADFALSASPASRTVAPGAGTTYTATVTPATGFTGTVTFGMTGLPAGATASFNPASVSTSGPTTLTVATSGSTPTGSYPLTITGTSGPVSHTAGVTLVVAANQGPTATITSPASNVTINPGAPVSFSGTGTDADGTIASYGWTFPGGTPSASSVAAPGNVTYSTPGMYTASLTVTDNGGAASSPATRTVTVADFALSASPASRTVAPGAGTTYTATVTPATGFTGTVTFGMIGLPAGATASFNPASVSTSGPTTLTVATSGSTPTGSYPLTITGTSGPVSHTAGVTLVVAANQGPTATITSPASNVTINPGAPVSFSGTGTDADGTIASYGWTFPGGTPSASSVAAPGNVTYSTPGMYTASLTVTDNGGAASSPATRTVTVADFALSASPASRTVAPGAGTTYTATVTPATGFTGTVTFGMTGLPAGATASFNPASVSTSGPTTLTVATSGSTPTGSYPLTITGTSGPVSHTAGVTLVVAANQGPTATITSPATNVTINPGAPVSFSGTGTDADGTIASYGWTFPGGTPSASSVAAPGNVTYSTPGMYTASLTVTDNGGAASSPATRTVTVADFALSASPASRTVAPGAGTTYTATVTPATGFTGTVTFGMTGLPAGATASFNPASVSTSGPTTLTVATSGSTPTGSYPLTITGTSGPVSHTAGVTLVVAANQGPTATITSPATNVTINPGAPVSFSGTGTDADGTIASYGWTFPGGTPSASSVAAPGNVTYSTPGMYTASLTVTDNGGAASSPATRTVTVADFALSASPASRTVAPGAGTTYTATVTPATGFTGTVTFGMTGLPAGATASFNPASVSTSGPTTLTVATSGSTPTGSYPLTITGTSGPVSHTAGVTLVVAANQGPTATITSPASNVTINPGAPVSFSGTGTDADGTIASYGWTFPGGTPSASSVAAPGNVTYSTPGMYTASLTVTDNGGAASSPATRTVTVADFALSASPASRTVAPGAGTTYTATVTPATGFTGTVTFGMTGLPAGATASFNPASVSTSGPTTLTVATSGSTPTGSYPLTITGTSGPVSHTATVTLVVAGEFSVSVTPTSRTITKTGSTTYEVTVTSQGFSGLLTLSVTGLPKFVQAKFTPSSLVNAGTSTLTISSNKNVTGGTYTLTVSAAGGGIVRSAAVTLIVQ